MLDEMHEGQIAQLADQVTTDPECGHLRAAVEAAIRTAYRLGCVETRAMMAEDLQSKTMLVKRLTGLHA